MKTMKYIAPLALVAVAVMAQAPSTILFQGSMVKNKIALTGKHKLAVHLCPTVDVDDLNGCESVYASDNVLFNEGYYSVLLGESNPLPSFDKQWYLHISVDGTTPESRAPITATPNALYASNAGKASLADSAIGAQRAKSLLSGATASDLSASGKITAKSFSYSAPKKFIMDIPVGSIAINPYQSASTWHSAAWSFGFVCPTAGTGLGKLVASYILNLPDGAIVDSVAVVAYDRVAYPIDIWIDVGDQSGAEAERTIIDFGATSPKTSWTKYGTGADVYRKTAPTVTAHVGHVVNKAKYIYYLTFAKYEDPGTTCLHPGEWDFTINRAQVFYRLSDL